jgi:protein-disulfide isomerase
LAPSTAAAGLPTEGRSKGSATAPLVIEEWADYQCPACRMLALDAMPAINDLIAAGQVRVEYRYKTFLGQESVWAAAAAECANEQGRFWEFNQRLYQEQRARNQGRFSRDNLKQYGAAVGLDSAPFNACVDSGRYEAAVRAENDRGAQLGVSSTPTLFLNGQPLSGAPTGPQLREIVTRLLNS